MKNVTFLFVIMFFLGAVSAQSQWISAPAAPTVVGSATNTQTSVQSYADGSGGLYSFWRDSRDVVNVFGIYGQHYNELGEPQWLLNGRQLVIANGNVQTYASIVTASGSAYLVWSVHSNVAVERAVYAQRLNADGSFAWDENLVVKSNGTANSVQLAESAGRLYVLMTANVIGGSVKMYLNEISASGELLMPLDQYNVVYNGQGVGSAKITPDEAGGAYVYYTNGNGSGALVFMNHFSAAGVNDSWPAWVNVTGGSAGLGGYYSAIGDDQGVTFCWNGLAIPNTTGTNLYARRLDIATGAYIWSDTTREICVAPGNQKKFYWKRSGNDYYMTWADGRPGIVGNYAIYARKFNKAGTVFWQADGVEVANLNTYTPDPEFDLDEENTMLICHKAGVGFMAQKVLSDGTLIWPVAGVLALTNSFAPFSSDYDMVYTGGSYLAISARSIPSGGSDGIFVSKIELPIIQLTQSANACNSYEYNDQVYDSSGIYTVNLAPDTVLTLTLTIYHAVADVEQNGGTLSTTSMGFLQWYNCDTGVPIDNADQPDFTPETNGNYQLVVIDGFCADTSACFQVIITGIADREKDRTWSIYPNPAKDRLHLQSSRGFSTSVNRLTIINIMGNVVWQSAELSQNMSIDISQLAGGVYTFIMQQGNAVAHQTFIVAR